MFLLTTATLTSDKQDHKTPHLRHQPFYKQIKQSSNSEKFKISHIAF